MWSTARTVAEGDLVIVWLTRDVIQPLVITSGKELNTKFGYYRHEDLIGVPYGSKIGSRNGKGFIHLLRPTPELWTLALPHRTQILYLADIAFVTSWLDIKPGSRVIEAGTGSGSFSHSTARTIGPTGHLWSYEFHETRASKAKEEFTRHGMSDTVTLTHRNVCKDGFTVTDTVDAVFLDLPAPWEAIPHAKTALRKDRITRICCFSPCMEQVQRTVTALNDAGFTEITMYESLIRPHQVETLDSLPSIRVANVQLKESEARREAKRLRQIASAHRDGLTSSSSGGGKRKRGDDTTPITDLQQPKAENSTLEVAEDRIPEKRMKTEQEENVEISNSQTPLSKAEDIVIAVDSITPNDSSSSESHQPINVSKAFPEVRGHTSYLTFAVLLPPNYIPSTTTSAAVTSTEATPEVDTTTS
ncbi:tRNA (adenine(58)-N(1))-methyltransferase catalytic subunit TRM61 [Abortiporus biennis]